MPLFKQSNFPNIFIYFHYMSEKSTHLRTDSDFQSYILENKDTPPINQQNTVSTPRRIAQTNITPF